MAIEKRRRFIINFTYFLIIVLLVYASFKFAMPVLSPFVFALLFAYILNRPINFLSRKTRMPRVASSLIFVILFYVILGAIISFIGVEIVTAAARFINNLPGIYENTLLPELQLLLDSLDKFSRHARPEFQALMVEIELQFMESLGSMVSNASIAALGFLSSLVTSVPGTVLDIIVMIISTFFLTIDYNKVYGFFLNQFSDRTRNIFAQVENYVVNTLFVCIKTYAIIMTITFIELSVGLTIIGINNPITVAACIAIFDIMPVLGTGGIMLPWVLISAIKGRFARALGLLCVYLFVTVVRNILEPKFVGGNLGIHPVLTLASMFAGASLFGVVGLFGFPIMLSLLRHLNENGTIELYKPLGEDGDEREDFKREKKPRRNQ